MLTEGLTTGSVRLSAGPDAEPEAQPADVRIRCSRLLSAIPATPAGRLIAIADHDLTASFLAYAGAIEITVHGWDISVACGALRPIPDNLATRVPVSKGMPARSRRGIEPCL